MQIKVLKTWIFPFLIFIQIVIVIFLSVNIFNKINKKLVSISSLDKNTINILGTSSLKYFYEPKPNTVLNDDEKWLSEKVVYTYNEDSLNERFNYTIKKPSNIYRVIVLGDSFAQGAHVNTKDNWTELLEDKLNINLHCKNISKFEVINLGVSGYDVEYEVERYRIRGQKYNPDLIIWMLVDNKRINELMEPFILDCDKGNLNARYDSNGKNVCYYKTRQNIINSIDKSKIEEIILNNFNKIFSLYSKNIVVLDLEGSHQNIVNKIDNSNRIKNIPFYLEENNYFPDGHPNKIGNQKISEEIFNYIIENKIIPCQQ